MGNPIPGNDAGSGTCYGFKIRSTLPLRYLRQGEGDPLEIDLGAETGSDAVPEGELLYEQMPNDRHPIHARLHGNTERYQWWLEGHGSFVIDPRVPRIVAPPAEDAAQREEWLWGIPAALCFMHRGDTSIHAAAVEVDGSAIVFAAPGGFGKTTLAAAFWLAGYRVLSEDMTCIRPGPLAVIPGPAVLRVRGDMMARFGRLPGVPVREVKGRVSLTPDTGTGTCTPIPILAVIFLRVMEDFKVQRVKAVDAIPDLWALSGRISSETGLSRCFATLSALATSVPVWNLWRPLRFEDLPKTVDRLISLSRDG